MNDVKKNNDKVVSSEETGESSSRRKFLKGGLAAAAGTVAEDAELEIEFADIVVSCSQCGSESPATVNRLLCAHCGDYRTRLVSGDEMILQRLELDGIEPLSPRNS